MNNTAQPEVFETPNQPKVIETPKPPEVIQKPVQPEVNGKPNQSKVIEKPKTPEVIEKAAEPEVTGKPNQPKEGDKTQTTDVSEKFSLRKIGKIVAYSLLVVAALFLVKYLFFTPPEVVVAQVQQQDFTGEVQGTGTINVGTAFAVAERYHRRLSLDQGQVDRPQMQWQRDRCTRAGPLWGEAADAGGNQPIELLLNQRPPSALRLGQSGNG